MSTVWNIPSWKALEEQRPLVKVSEDSECLDTFSRKPYHTLTRQEWLDDYLYDNELNELIEFNEDIVHVVMSGDDPSTEVEYVITKTGAELKYPLVNVSQRDPQTWVQSFWMYLWAVWLGLFILQFI